MPTPSGPADESVTTLYVGGLDPVITQDDIGSARSSSIPSILIYCVLCQCPRRVTLQ